jgi:hypothetical protein
MARTPMPNNKKVCFKAVYPKTQWQEVPCTAPPNRPYPPKHGHPRPDIVGNGTDFSAEAASPISWATGFFSSVTGVTNESGNVNGNPPAAANTFSLQLNTKPFATSLCSGSPNAGCEGWQQFVYSNSGFAFVQYWLLSYNTTCPAGWNTYSFSGSSDIYCWKNGANAVSVPVQSITNLANLSLTGTANPGGSDTVIMAIGTGDLSAANQDSVLNLASGWKAAEFIIVGDCCSSQANFNAGATIVIRTTLQDGTTSAPTCASEGFTGETNNLTLAQPCCPLGGSPSVIEFMQSNITGATWGPCSAIPNPPTNLTGTVH